MLLTHPHSDTTFAQICFRRYRMVVDILKYFLMMLFSFLHAIIIVTSAVQRLINTLKLKFNLGFKSEILFSALKSSLVNASFMQIGLSIFSNYNKKLCT